MKCSNCELLNKLEQYRLVVKQLQQQRDYLAKCLDNSISRTLKPAMDRLDTAICELGCGSKNENT